MLHGASPDNLPTPEPDTNITKVTIKINSFFNVNKKFAGVSKLGPEHKKSSMT
jgi:hypothetical protein